VLPSVVNPRLTPPSRLSNLKDTHTFERTPHPTRTFQVPCTHSFPGRPLLIVATALIHTSKYDGGIPPRSANYDYNDQTGHFSKEAVDAPHSHPYRRPHHLDGRRSQVPPQRAHSTRRNLRPQSITRHGKPAVVVVSAAEWERKTKRKGTLAEFFWNSPLRDSGLVNERFDDPPRKIDL
jgi:prevent-host-death family protein